MKHLTMKQLVERHREENVCIVEGCDKEPKCNFFCCKHWQEILEYEAENETKHNETLY